VKKQLQQIIIIIIITSKCGGYFRTKIPRLAKPMGYGKLGVTGTAASVKTQTCLSTFRKLERNNTLKNKLNMKCK
jgi:hypothetical protein